MHEHKSTKSENESMLTPKTETTEIHKFLKSIFRPKQEPKKGKGEKKRQGNRGQAWAWDEEQGRARGSRAAQVGQAKEQRRAG